MARTNFNRAFPMNTTEYAYTSSNHSLIKPGETIPLHIPSLMPNISQGEPKISTKITKGTSIFKNASACKPATKRIVKTQNFINPRFSRNQTWDGIKKKRGEEYYVPKRSRVIRNTVGGTPKKMNFGTDYV